MISDKKQGDEEGCWLYVFIRDLYDIFLGRCAAHVYGWRKIETDDAVMLVKNKGGYSTKWYAFEDDRRGAFVWVYEEMFEYEERDEL